MKNDHLEPMISREDIIQAVEKIGRQITHDYHEQDLLVVGILKGAVIFFSDLVRTISLPIEIDFMAVSSYGVDTSTSGVVRLIKDLECSITGRHLLLVEDIIDTGLTLQYLVESLKSRKPASIKTCCLLDKPSRRKAQINPDYVGFAIEDQFVVGYGLDYAECYRNLKDICILHLD